MRVDVGDVIHRRAGLPESSQYGSRSAATLGVGSSDVVRVARDAATGDLGVDAGTTREGVLLGLENERRRSFAHDKPVAVDVVRARRGRRVVVALGQRLHRREGCECHGVDAALGATGKDHVGEPELQVLIGVRDGLGARRAGGDVGAGKGACVKAHAEGRRRGVGHEHGDGHRKDAARTLLSQRVPRIQQGP